MQLVFRGSVNRWECDENDHMNVRFYSARHSEILAAGLLQQGLVGVAEVVARLRGTTVQHHRFLRESRLSAPLSGYFGVVALQQAPCFLTELRHSMTGDVLASCLHRLPTVVAEVTAELPEQAAPRGIQAALQLPAQLDRLEAMGFHCISMGLLQPADADADGVMHPAACMGRLSDGMPHLWSILRGKADAHSETEGGAVLEYRFDYFAPLHVGQRFAIYSGIAEVGPKIQRFAHLLVDPATQRVCVSAESIGVRMDLQARRAMTMDAAALQRMRAQMLTLGERK